MPNIALNVDGEEIVLGYRFYEGDPKVPSLRTGGPYRCPHCQSPMSFRCGPVRCGHFYHEKSDCVVDWKPESEEHIYAKYFFQKLIQDNLGLIAKQEVIIGKNERVCDVLVSSASAAAVALEIQLSKITLDEIKERTASYRRHNIHVIWFLDKRKFSNFIEPAILHAKFFFINIEKLEHKEDFEIDIKEIEYKNEDDFKKLLFLLFKIVLKKCLDDSKTPLELSMNIYGDDLHIDECESIFNREKNRSHFLNEINSEMNLKNMIAKYQKEISRLNVLNEILNVKNEELKENIHIKSLEISELKNSLSSYISLAKATPDGKGNLFILRGEVFHVTKNDDGSLSLKIEHILPTGETRRLKFTFDKKHILVKLKKLIDIETCAPSNTFVNIYGYMYISSKNYYDDYVIDDIDIFVKGQML